MRNYSGIKKDLFNLTAASIVANIDSLIGQLEDYDFLDITEEQYKRLEKIYQDLHDLVKEVTKS